MALTLIGVGVAVAVGLREPEPVAETPAAAQSEAPSEGPEQSPEPQPPMVPTEAPTAMSSPTESEPEATMAAPAARASLRITATPWAEVRLDHRALGTTPVRRITVPAGTHRIRFECPPLGASVEHSVTLEPGADRALFADLQADPPRVTER